MQHTWLELTVVGSMTEAERMENEKGMGGGTQDGSMLRVTDRGPFQPLQGVRRIRHPGIDVKHARYAGNGLQAMGIEIKRAHLKAVGGDRIALDNRDRRQVLEGVVGEEADEIWMPDQLLAYQRPQRSDERIVGWLERCEVEPRNGVPDGVSDRVCDEFAEQLAPFIE